MKKQKKHKWKYRINLRKKILVLIILGVSLFVGLGYALLETNLGISGIFQVRQPFITVTFDSNDGEIDTLSKKVIPGHTYGRLPEPIKSNYFFKGWSLVPSDYQQVEYIESTAGSYINSNYQANSDTKIVAKYNFTEDKGYGVVFGARGGDLAYMLADASLHDTNLYFYYGDSSIYAQSNGNINFGQDYTVTAEKGIASISDFEDIGTTNDSTFQMQYPLYIFTFNESNSVPSSFATGGVRIYYMKIYENNILVKNFVPVVKKSNGEAGLFDTVSNEFYGNSGSGSFRTGNPNDEFVSATDIVERNADHELNAIWVRSEYTVTLNANEGSIPETVGWTGSGASATKDIAYSSQYGTLPIPIRDGYTFGGWQFHNDEYQKVEYVENTSTKYIDTGVKMDSNKSFEIKFKYTSPTASYTTGLIVGSYDGTVNANALSYHQGSFRTHTTTNGQPVVLKSADTTNTHIVNWNAQTNKVSIDDGPLIDMSPTRTSNNTWYLFGGNYGNGLDYSSQGRIYYMKIYDNGILIKDFVPAIERKTGNVGLYDKVNDEFHIGMGGELDVGANVNDGDILGTAVTINSTDIMKLEYNHTLIAKWEKDNTNN